MSPAGMAARGHSSAAYWERPPAATTLVATSCLQRRYRDVGARTDAVLTAYAVALDRDGGVAGWNETDGLSGDVTGIVRATTGRRTLVLAGQLGAGPVTLGSDRFAIVEIHGHVADLGLSGESVRRRIDLVIGRIDTTIVSRQRLATADGIWPAALASSPRGDVAIAWVECRSTCNTGELRLRVAVRAAGTRHARCRPSRRR